MNKLYTFFLILLFLIPNLKAQEVKVIDPPFWWANMPVTELQIQLYGENLGSYRATVNYAGVEIKRQIAVDSPNYLFIYLDISEKAEAGKLEIILKNGDGSITVPYELLEENLQKDDIRDLIQEM